MITKEDTYRLALERKAQERAKRESEYERLLDAAYKAEPRLKEMESKQAAIGAGLAIKALSDPEGLSELRQQLEALSAEKKRLLAQNGVEEPVVSCELCNDTGYRDGKICDCVHALATKIATEQMNELMPLAASRFEDFDLEYYPDKTLPGGANPKRRMTAIFHALKEYADGFDPNTSPNLLLLGQAGLGKTHLTMSVISVLLEKGFLPVYASSQNLFDHLEKEKFSRENIGLLDKVLQSDLLVIDDLGAEMNTVFTRSALYNLVNSRLLTRKPVIINTNLSMREIEERYSARVSSRLIGSFEAYKFLGDDIRQIKAMRNKG